MNQNYSITLNTDQELTIDIDDLIGIIQQIDAIMLGWGMEFSVLINSEEQELVYKWDKEHGTTVNKLSEVVK